MLKLLCDRSSSKPLRVLCLGAHADDIEIGCGGTILRLTGQRRKIECTWIVFSGSPTRRKEAETSAGRFLKGAARKQVQLHTFRDGYFPYNGADIKDCFEELKRRCDPDLIFTHYRHDLHQDHRLICE
ncbi:PIG-L domain-containing protein, partial [candidate division GN15 bacterium]